MFQVEIDGKKVDAKVTFYTAQLYENEFCKDLISDFYGVQDMSPIISLQENSVVKVDFTKVSWLAATRALWAAIKTADKNAPSYSAWMEATEGVDTWRVRELLDAAITDCFFRTETAVEEGKE